MNYPAYPQYQQYFPNTQYQQNMPQPQPQYQPQTVPQPQAINQGLLWVQGEAGAKSYLVTPNTTVLLMDSEGSRFYLKSTDNAGMPNLRTFEYTEVTQNAPQSQQSAQTNLDDKYVTRDEYEGLKRQYAEIMDKLNTFSTARHDSQPTKGTAPGNNGRRNKGGNDNE